MVDSYDVGQHWTWRWVCFEAHLLSHSCPQMKNCKYTMYGASHDCPDEYELAMNNHMNNQDFLASTTCVNNIAQFTQDDRWAVWGY